MRRQSVIHAPPSVERCEEDVGCDRSAADEIVADRIGQRTAQRRPASSDRGFRNTFGSDRRLGIGALPHGVFHDDGR